MEKYYTITSAKRLDGQDNYGNVTDSVFIQGVEGSALWKHAQDTVVTPGLMVYGALTDEVSKAGKPWKKFSKKQIPDDYDSGNTQDSGDTSSPQAASKALQAPSNQGNGAKQGMAINNATAYVLKTAPENLEPSELADEIQRYAKAIYKIDLTTTDQDIIDMMNE